MSSECWHKNRKKRKNLKDDNGKKIRKISYEMPTLGFHVPDNSELLKKILAKAAAFHDSKTSSYVRNVVERDIEGSLTPQSENPVLELARVFHPTLLPDLDAHMEFDERRVIARFLEALRDAVMRDGFNPEAPFALYNSADQMTALLAAKPGGPELLRQMRDFAFSQPLAAAEDQTPYQPPETKAKSKIKTGPAAPTRADGK